MPPSMSAMYTQARNVRSLAKKTCVRVASTAPLHDGTPLYRLGVDLDGLHARLVRVAYTRFADGVVAAARAEHRAFVSLLVSPRWLCLLARGTALRLRGLARCGEAL